jgi:hypothetical protein
MVRRGWLRSGQVRQAWVGQGKLRFCDHDLAKVMIAFTGFGEVRLGALRLGRDGTVRTCQGLWS